ncbi:hypothetical protein Ancab_038942 [Ancistrocladus abbreviatus]
MVAIRDLLERSSKEVYFRDNSSLMKIPNLSFKSKLLLGPSFGTMLLEDDFDEVFVDEKVEYPDEDNDDCPKYKVPLVAKRCVLRTWGKLLIVKLLGKTF